MGLPEERERPTVETSELSTKCPSGFVTDAPDVEPPRPARFHPRDRRRRPARRQAWRPRPHPVSARAERLPAHRPRQVDLPELRRRRTSSAALCNLRFDDTNPDQGRRRVRRVDPGGRALARVRLGRADVLRLGLLRAAVPLRRAADPRRPGLRRQPDGRRDPRVSRHADRAGPEQPVPRPRRSTRTSTCSGACGPASSPTARTCCARRSTWRRRTSTCATRRSTGSGTRRTTAPATPGASIRPTTTRTRSRTRIEGITHSLCTLEFEDHRPLYDWVVDHIRPTAARSGRGRSRSSSRGST